MANIESIYVVAGLVYRNRNAKGAPEKYRNGVKAAVRGDPERRGPLRMALMHAHLARDCWRHGDLQTYTAQMMLAQNWIAKAETLTLRTVKKLTGESISASKVGRGKLTDKQREKIACELRAGTSHKTLMVRFKVSAQTLSRISKKINYLPLRGNGRYPRQS